MGRFYLPKDTLGVYDAGKRWLIVYVGRESSIGFEGTGAEIAALDFSFSDDPIMEVYNAGPTRRETLVPTSSKATFTVQALNASGKDMTPSITVQVVNDRFAVPSLPEGQMDVTACWMAGISFASQGLMTRPTY